MYHDALLSVQHFMFTVIRLWLPLLACEIVKICLRDEAMMSLGYPPPIIPSKIKRFVVFVFDFMCPNFCA